MIPLEKTTQTTPRDIVITNAVFTHGNLEAWMNIIQSYQRLHPEHQVVILYEGEEVNNLMSFFKLEKSPNRQGFQLVVNAPDGHRKDVPKLYRLLVDGAGPNYERYLGKEVFKVLNLF